MPVEWSQFQFTHPVWGATLLEVSLVTLPSFQFTHPVWGATYILIFIQELTDVSIHAPRVGCDASSLLETTTM